MFIKPSTQKVASMTNVEIGPLAQSILYNTLQCCSTGIRSLGHKEF